MKWRERKERERKEGGKGRKGGRTGTGKLGQDKHTMPLLLARDILIRHQVHPIPRTRNQTRVRNRIQRRQFTKRNRTVHEMNRHPVDRAEATVDPTDEFVH